VSLNFSPSQQSFLEHCTLPVTDKGVGKKHHNLSVKLMEGKKSTWADTFFGI